MNEKRVGTNVLRDIFLEIRREISFIAMARSLNGYISTNYDIVLFFILFTKKHIGWAYFFLFFFF